LDKLEQRGLISQTRSPADRRAVLVSITAAGRWLLDQLAEPLRQCHRRQLGHLRPEQLRQLIDLLRLVRSPHEPDESHWK
jgi:DNA-binding MarR family transcriptional regulator